MQQGAVVEELESEPQADDDDTATLVGVVENVDTTNERHADWLTGLAS